MEPQLIIGTIVIYLIYSTYENIKTSNKVSKCFTKEVKKKHNFITRLKVQILPKSFWMDSVKSEHKHALIKANQYWQSSFKRLIVATGIFITALFIIALPSIYYLLTH
jgi:hypothetical protein